MNKLVAGLVSLISISIVAIVLGATVVNSSMLFVGGTVVLAISLGVVFWGLSGVR